MQIIWRIKYGTGKTGYPPWRGWRADTLSIIKWTFRSLYNRRGIFNSAIPRYSGNILSRWRRHSDRNFSLTFSKGRVPPCRDGRSQACWSIIPDSPYQTPHRLPRATGQRHSWSPDTLSRPHGYASDFGPSTMPKS